MKVKSATPLQKLTSPAEFKFAGGDGSFSGYAAVFGNVDQGGDVIEPGAFKEFAKTRDGKVLILWQHDSQQPIGKAIVEQDQKGLRVRGSLALDDATAAKAYGLMKGGLIDSMSIGYQILPGGAEMLNSGARLLTGLKLFEVSVVTFGMNDQARVEAVKSVLDCNTSRDLEHLLREIPQFKLSSRKAKAAANALWPILAERDAPGDARDERAAKAFTASLDSLNQLLKGHKP
jgi:HK97 family phage prohead protease